MPMYQQLDDDLPQGAGTYVSRKIGPCQVMGTTRTSYPYWITARTADQDDNG